MDKLFAEVFPKTEDSLVVAKYFSFSFTELILIQASNTQAKHIVKAKELDAERKTKSGK